MKSLNSFADRKQAAAFTLVCRMLAITPLCLLLAAANTCAYAQTFDDVSNSSAATSNPSSPADWTEFHRDNMQRWNPYETTLGIKNTNELKVKWNLLGQHFSPYEPPCNGSFPENLLFGATSSPAIANGVAYYGSNDGNLYALNVTTGAKLWSLAKACVESSPAVVDGVVYYGSVDGNLYAVNAKTGTRLWSYATAGVVQSSPAVVNGTVYVGSDDGNLYALNAHTGARLWSFATGGPVDSSPAVANGIVYFGSNDLKIYALNATTGSRLWTYASTEGVESSSAVANGIVYVGDDIGYVYALNATTGAKVWSYYTEPPDACCSSVISSPAVSNGSVYVGSTNGSVFALKADTGALVWSYVADPGGGSGGVESSPAVANGVLYVGTGVGKDLALNASTGALLWSYEAASGPFPPGTFGGVYSSAAVVNGVVYFVHFYGNGDEGALWDGIYAFSVGADLFLRIWPSTTTVHQGDLLTYAFPVWNLGPDNAVQEVLNTQVPAGTTFDYIRISGTPGLGTCTHPPYQGTGQIVCHENSSMAPNTTWTVRLTVKVTAAAGTVITENAATMADTPDPNMANNTATVSLKVQ